MENNMAVPQNRKNRINMINKEKKKAAARERDCSE